MLKSLLMSLFLSTTAMADIVVEKIIYKDGSDTFEGVVAYDNKINKKVPGVMIIHNWLGISDETISKARDVAKLGYVAFLGDIYGMGVRAKTPQEAGALAGKYKSDLKTLRARSLLAINELKKNKHVDPSKIFVSGYCFGGTAALEVARSGADILGAISFHGGLYPSADDKNIKSEILVLHGAIDPAVKKTDLDGMLKSFDDNNVNYDFVAYSKAVHSFTDKTKVGKEASASNAYNKKADERSWDTFKNFLSELSK